jgi:hypothetical protein
LVPIKKVLSQASAKAAAANSTKAPSEIAPMQDFLTRPHPGFKGQTEFPQGANTPISFQPTKSPILGPNGQPIRGTPQLVRGNSPDPTVANEQTPLTMLDMRRQFNKDFISNWNPFADTKGKLGVARKAYKAFGDETDRIIPGGAARDDQIHSGIVARDAAEKASMQPTLGQRMLFRMSRPTGGLVPLMIGMKEGGPLGGAAAMTAAEAAASPVPLMIGARSLYGAGKQMGAPSAAGSAPAGGLIPIQRRRQE